MVSGTGRRGPVQLLTAASLLVSMVWPRRVSSFVWLAAVGVAGASLLPCAWAQVVEQQTKEPVGLLPPTIDCAVTWSETWSKCSPDGTQTRRYTVDVYPTRYAWS